MADNARVNPSTGADQVYDFRFDELAGGVLVPYTKLDAGADGVSRPVTDADGLPVKNPSYDGRKDLVGTAADRFFWNGADFNLTDDWQVFTATTLGGALTEQTTIGSAYPNGMTITGPLGGAAAGSTPYLNIASGTAGGAQTVILSRAIFRPPVDLRYQISASQRIANNSFRIGFLEVDDAGSIVTSTSVTTATAVRNARNAAMAQWTGTTATTGDLITRGAGSALETLAAAYGTGFTTVATGSAPNLIAASAFGLFVARDRINARGYTLNVLTNAGTDFAVDRVLINPTKNYKLAIIVENSAVVTTTDWRVHLVNLLDATRFDVSPIYTGKDRTKAFPVDVLGTVGVTATLAAATVRAGFVAGAGIWYDDSSTNLAISATFTGTSRDATVTATATAFANAATYAGEVRICAESDVSGTLWLEVSRDNVAWRRIRSVATAAITGGGQAAEIVYRPAWRYWRAGYTNGAVAQTRFALGSLATAV